MNSLKSLLGLLPTARMNAQLRSNISRQEKEAIVVRANSSPNRFSNVDRIVRVSTNFGFDIYCDRNDVIGQEIIFTGQWEASLSKTIQACLEPGDMCIDIGANMGYDSVLMSKAVGPKGLVLAFEPDLGNLQKLAENIEKLGLQNVVIQSSALGSQPALLKLMRSTGSNSGLSTLRADEAGGTTAQPVVVTRLDSVLASLPPSRIKLIKMDVEGFEWHVLKGMAGAVDNTDYLICEINHSFLKQADSSAADIFGFMRERGFKSFCTEPSGDSPWVKSDQNYATTASHFDVLFCRSVGPRLAPMIPNGG